VVLANARVLCRRCLQVDRFRCGSASFSSLLLLPQLGLLLQEFRGATESLYFELFSENSPGRFPVRLEGSMCVTLYPYAAWDVKQLNGVR